MSVCAPHKGLRLLAALVFVAACGGGEDAGQRDTTEHEDDSGSQVIVTVDLGGSADAVSRDALGERVDVLVAEMEESSSVAATVSIQPAADAYPKQLSSASGVCVACNGDTFGDYGVNPPVDPSEDAFSTFALDVDTASYSIVRNMISTGQLPPTDAVRVEEFVNYFDGGYESKPDSFAVIVDAAVSPFMDKPRVLLRVGVQAPHQTSEAVEPDSVVLVVDRSGSMGEPAGDSTPRYVLVQEAIRLVADGLGDDVRIGVVAYSDYADVVFEMSQLADRRAELDRIVRDEIVPTDSTNAEAGLTAGFEMARSEADAGRNVIVLLLSDGVANVGATRTAALIEQIGDRHDIGLSTIGVGLGPFNDELMEQVANLADGSYHYIDTLIEAERILGENLSSLLSVAAEEAKLQVEFNPEIVDTYRLLGFENRVIADDDFWDDTRDAGEVGIGQSSTAIYELVLNEGAEQSIETAATVTLRYRRPVSGEIAEAATSISGQSLTGEFSAAAPRFRLQATAAQFAEVLRNSPYSADAGMATLVAEALSIAAELPGDDDADELARLVSDAQRLRRSAADLASVPNSEN